MPEAHCDQRVSPKVRFALLFGILTLAAYICVARFRLESDLLAFLPTNEQAPQLEVTRKLMRGPLKNTLILNVVPENPALSETAREVAIRLAHDLSEHPGLEKIAAGPDPDFEKAVFELYFPRRYLFAQSQLQGSEFWSSKQLAERLKQTKSFLASPAASVYRPLLPQDPLLLFHERLSALSELQPQGLTLEQGQFIGADGVAFLFAQTRADLSFTEKAALLAHINRRFKEYRQSNALILEMSGALPFEVEGEQATRDDFSRVSAVSFAAIVLLSLLLFRGLLPLLLIFLPILSGMLVACAATLLVFGQVHGLTLAFGAALLGVGMDYPLHLFNDQALHQDTAERALPRVLRGLLVGCGTTLAGFLAFGATKSPALSQVAVFTGAGLLTSLLVTLFLLPHLPVRVGLGTIQRRLVQSCDAVVIHLSRHRPALISLCVGLLALAIGTLSQASWDTSTEALNPASTELRRADLRVRQRLALSEETLVVQAETPQATLLKNHELSLKLNTLKKEGRLESFDSLSALYLPQILQEENRRQAASPKTQHALASALTQAEFSEQVFAPAFADMAAPEAPLSLVEIKQSPLAEVLESFWIDLDGAPVALTRVNAPRETVAAIAAGEANTFRYNPSEFLGVALAALTRSLTTVLVLGGSLMLGIVLIRHRRLRPSAVAFVPAACAALGTLAIHSVFFGPLHLFHVLAAVIVLSMGIDYGAFLVEAQGEENLPWPSLIGAALSTMASFGTLALSAVPALHALGGIIFVGILIALVMTLVLSTFLEKNPPTASSTTRLTTLAASTFIVVLANSCSPSSLPPDSADSIASQPSPGNAGLTPEQLRTALLSPSEIPHLFWQQRLTIQFADQEHRINAVIQNDGQEFQVLALGPANTRLFLISQHEKEVSLKMFVDRQVNLDPALLVLDIQRALFWFPEKSPLSEGNSITLVRGFCARDVWANGGIQERRISDQSQGCNDPDFDNDAGLLIRYEPAYRPRTAPQRVTLSHQQRSYSILVEHLSTQEVAQSTQEVAQ